MESEDLNNVTTVIHGLKIHQVILIKICDIKSIHFRRAYFKFNRSRYRSLICQGRITLLNQYSAHPQETSYKFLLDDGTGSVQAFYTLKKNESLECLIGCHEKYLDISERFGLNVRGQHIPADSEEYSTIMNNVKQHMGMIYNNFKLQPSSFQYQDFNKKACVRAWPFRNRSNEICLKILDLNVVNQTETESMASMAVQNFYDKRF